MSAAGRDLSRLSTAAPSPDATTVPGTTNGSGYETPQLPSEAVALDVKSLLTELHSLANTDDTSVTSFVKLQQFILSHKPQKAFQERIGKIKADSSKEVIRKSARRLTQMIFKNLRDPSRFVGLSSLLSRCPPSRGQRF